MSRATPGAPAVIRVEYGIACRTKGKTEERARIVGMDGFMTTWSRHHGSSILVVVKAESSPMMDEPPLVSSQQSLFDIMIVIQDMFYLF